MSVPLIEQARSIIHSMTVKLEQSSSREQAADYIEQLNIVYEALLQAMALQKEVDRLRSVAGAQKAVEARTPKVLSTTHIIDHQALRCGKVDDVLDAVENALRQTTGYVARDLLKEAGLRGGFSVNTVPFDGALRLHYAVGIHHEGGKSMEDILKDVGPLITKIRAT